MIALPAYVDQEAWDGFCDMRKAAKKPLTTRAAKLVLYELYRIKEAGHCPNAALDQSTCHCWADVYVPQSKPIAKANGCAVSETSAYLESQRLTDAERVASAEARRAAMQSVKRA
jgi:hypothetical protein